MSGFGAYPNVTVLVGGGSCAHAAPTRQGQPTGYWPEQNSVVPGPGTGPSARDMHERARDRAPEVYDPYETARQFPERWQRYVRTNFMSPAHVARAFAVSEKTAANWWQGRGVNGRYVAVAMRLHPVQAHQILFAA